MPNVRAALAEVDDSGRSREESYRDLFDHCSDLIGSHDMDGAILAANASLGRALNLSTDALCESNVRKHLVHGYDGAFDEYLLRLRGDGIASGLVAVVGADGSRRVWEYSSTLGTDAAKRPIARTVARDVTEREASLSAVHHSEQHFRSMIENVSDLMAVIETDGTIRYHSPSIGRVLGIDGDTLAGVRFLDLVHPDDAAAASQFLENQFANAEANAMVELRLQHRNGSSRSFEVVARNLVVSKKVTAVVTGARDITDRKLLETQLAQAVRLTSLGRLAATVAHEFNNVLMGMQPFAELMQRANVAPAMAAKAAWHISNSIQRGKRIALDILRFTQPAQPIAVAVDLASWWEEFAPEAETVVGNLVSVVSEIEHDSCAIVDKEQLCQVVANLVANARDAMPAGGTVSFNVSRPVAGAEFGFGIVTNPERFIHIAVSDTGKGISPEVMRHIFEPLFTTKKSGGTGLGLAVAHQILIQNDGLIFAESETGRGSTFHLFLPAAAEAPDDSRVTPAAVRAVDGQTLLMVEDEKAIVEGITTLLAAIGIRVFAVGTGGEAAAAVIRFRPDVVLLDLGLPDMDGADVYEILRKQSPFLPVIFATGHGDKQAIQERLGDRRTRFLQKPFEVDSLLHMISDLQPKGGRT